MPGTTIFRLTDDLPTEALVSVGCAAPTTVHAFQSAGGIVPGETIAIQGAGPVGLFSLILALESGASKIIMLDPLENRLHASKSIGADYCLSFQDYSTPHERVAKIHELTDGLGADVVIECSGSPESVQEGWKMCRDRGGMLR